MAAKYPGQVCLIYRGKAHSAELCANVLSLITIEKPARTKKSLTVKKKEAESETLSGTPAPSGGSPETEDRVC